MTGRGEERGSVKQQDGMFVVVVLNPELLTLLSNPGAGLFLDAISATTCDEFVTSTAVPPLFLFSLNTEFHPLHLLLILLLLLHHFGLSLFISAVCFSLFFLIIPLVR